MRTTCAELASLIDVPLGISTWVPIHQGRIDQFAEATEDRQWIHVDPQRAAQGPFGTTVAHGYLTLSLVSFFLLEMLEVTDAIAAVNYGLDRVRFPSPVPVDACIRARATIVAVEDLGHTIQVKTKVTLHSDASPKPAAVAEVLTRFSVAES